MFSSTLYTLSGYFASVFYKKFPPLSANIRLPRLTHQKKLLDNPAHVFYIEAIMGNFFHSSEVFMITYDYYRIFYFVAQYHSFTKAAEILKNNQPNITRCMNNLESELGCKLFIRSHQGVTLTAEGEKVYERVAVAYEQLRTVEEELALERSLESGLITIGASETALRLMLLSRLEHFHTRYPHVRLRISNHSTPQAIQALENGLVDFAVVTSPVEIRKPLHKIPIFPFREILIGGSKYASLSAAQHHLGELSEYPFISLAKDTGTRELYAEYFLNHNLAFHPDMEAATTDQILPMVEYNLGIGFYPEELARDALSSRTVCRIPLVEEAPKREICLIINPRQHQNAAAKELIEELLERV